MQESFYKKGEFTKDTSVLTRSFQAAPRITEVGPLRAWLRADARRCVCVCLCLFVCVCVFVCVFTRALQADKSNDQKSLNRALDRRLVFVVRRKSDGK